MARSKIKDIIKVGFDETYECWVCKFYAVKRILFTTKTEKRPYLIKTFGTDEEYSDFFMSHYREYDIIGG